MSAVGSDAGRAEPEPGDTETGETETGETETGAPQGALQIIVVTGLSGAGRSTAAKCLEDLGYFVVDNLPPELIATMVDLGSRSHGAVTKIAVVMDVRSRAFSSDLRGTIEDLASRGLAPRVLFLEASDGVLVRRYESVRREHPLQGGGRLIDGITAERRLLAPLRETADLVLDTSDRSVHQLRRAIEQTFVGEASQAARLRATVLSFGFKYGLPVDADMVADVRFLPNPFWIPELREQTGLDPQVSGYVMAQQGADVFLDLYTELLRTIGAGYRREGKHFLTLAIGCTGGKHRSVAISEVLAERLRSMDVHTTVMHRDLGRE